MSVVKILCCLLLTFHLSEGKKIKGHRAGAVDTEQRVVPKEKAPYVISCVFKMFSEGEDNCTLDPLQLHTFTSCGFNSSNPLIIITHGWSVDCTMENWVYRMATALKANLIDVNVVITDWLSLACQHYTKAALATRTIGKDIAHLLQSLQAHYQYPLKKVHLIGYSLGAHISGFAGSYLKGSQKIGRITGLDPAGPMFEGMSTTDRLSPDDAEFVDAIHTFTQERLGLSVGIKQAVGHYDFYPNGGDFQPGCDLHNILEHVTQYGILALDQTVKCAHERSVNLFIDSVLNKDKQSRAYRCTDLSAFNKGMCLDCRKNHCNTLGYYIKKVHSGISKRLYLNTRPRMPYKLFHYQFKIQFVNHKELVKPTLTISLTGTKEESGDLALTITEEILGNKTYTFLITLDRDLGDLMFLNLQWKKSDVWMHVWNKFQCMFAWGSQRSDPQLTVGRISIKAGETQERTNFCAMNNEGKHIEESEDKVFVRCKEDRPRHRRRKQH